MEITISIKTNDLEEIRSFIESLLCSKNSDQKTPIKIKRMIEVKNAEEVGKKKKTLPTDIREKNCIICHKLFKPKYPRTKTCDDCRIKSDEKAKRKKTKKKTESIKVNEVDGVKLKIENGIVLGVNSKIPDSKFRAINVDYIKQKIEAGEI